MESSYQEVHDLLRAGKIVTLEFFSKTEAEKFRSGLSVYKSRVDKMFSDLGMGIDKQRLSFLLMQISGSATVSRFQALVSLEEPIQPVQFIIVSAKDRDPPTES